VSNFNLDAALPWGEYRWSSAKGSVGFMQAASKTTQPNYWETFIDG
jgi:hypothetical protein